MKPLIPHGCLAIALACQAGLVTPASGQAAPVTPYTTIVQDLRDREYQPVRRHLEEAAALMPDSAYQFQPVAGLRVFADEINHVADVNFRLCGMALRYTGSGSVAAPTGRPDTAKPSDKAAVSRRLADSFALCDRAMGGLTDDDARKPTVGPYMVASHLIAMVGHISHEYGKITLILRMNGLAPPA